MDSKIEETNTKQSAVNGVTAVFMELKRELYAS